MRKYFGVQSHPTAAHGNASYVEVAIGETDVVFRDHTNGGGSSSRPAGDGPAITDSGDQAASQTG